MKWPALVLALVVAGTGLHGATLKRGPTYGGVTSGATQAELASPKPHAMVGAAQAGRQRAPQTFSCDPNHLTSYTGVVIRYTRQVGSTTLRIKTDDDTTENVTLKHPGTDDPSALFRYQTEPFTPAHWARIERSKGVLVPNTRAAAWVCDDGQVMVDWGVRGDAAGR